MTQKKVVIATLLEEFKARALKNDYLKNRQNYNNSSAFGFLAFHENFVGSEKIKKLQYYFTKKMWKLISWR